MITFKDLKFEPRQGLSGIQAKTFFPNGYVASVIQGYGTYGNEAGLYELAVGKGTSDGWSLDYTTSITDDVEGYLSETAVTKLLQDIAGLPVTEGKPK